MFDLVIAHWGQILSVLSIAMGAAAAIHAAMTKEEVRAAIGWVGVIILSPIVGALLYAVAGINRIRRASLSSQRDVLLPEGRDSDALANFDAQADIVRRNFGERFAAHEDAWRPCGALSADAPATRSKCWRAATPPMLR